VYSQVNQPLILPGGVYHIFQLSNEKKPGWLGYRGDYTTQLYRDYKETIIRIPIKPTRMTHGKYLSFFFFVAQLGWFNHQLAS